MWYDKSHVDMRGDYLGLGLLGRSSLSSGNGTSSSKGSRVSGSSSKSAGTPPGVSCPPDKSCCSSTDKSKTKSKAVIFVDIILDLTYFVRCSSPLLDNKKLFFDIHSSKDINGFYLLTYKLFIVSGKKYKNVSVILLRKILVVNFDQKNC
jgi:hypothetical protein